MNDTTTIWTRYKHVWHLIAFLVFMKLAGAYHPKIKNAKPLPKKEETVLACG